MQINKFGQPILSEADMIDIFMSDHDATPRYVPTDSKISFHPELELDYIPLLVTPESEDISQEEYDSIHSKIWFMPEDYKKMDIAEWILHQCTNQHELQRVAEELFLFQERDLFDLLRYMKYLVDTMRAHNIVWGVGRGSSTASYVLYKIGVHRIDSIYYGLDIKEFLKND